MVAARQAIDDFLAQRRIAVAGVSRDASGAHGGNIIYRRLHERGYEVFAVNPNADEVEGDRCYRRLADIPGGVDGVVIATPPAAALSVAEECAALGIGRVWMHGAMGRASVSDDAHAYCRAHGIASIAGACPLMYGRPSDGGHRFMRTMLGLFGRLPREA